MSSARNIGHADGDICGQAAGEVAPPGLARWSRGQIEDAIGEPLMVPDPLLTVVQAAALLAVSVAQLDGLVAAGVLPRRGNAASPRRFLLFELERIDTSAVALPAPVARRRRRRGRVMARPVDAAHRVSLREAAQIIGLTESTRRSEELGGLDH